MFVDRTIYFIVSKERPIMFHAGNGELSDDFAEAFQYESYERAYLDLDTFDEPDKFEVIKGRVVVNL